MITAIQTYKPRRVDEPEYIPTPEEIRAGCLEALLIRKEKEVRAPTLSLLELFRKQRQCGECETRLSLKRDDARRPVMSHKQPFTLVCLKCAQEHVVADHQTRWRSGSV